MIKKDNKVRVRNPINLRLAVWQFVRIMVQLETSSRARGHKNAPTLYSYWRPAWQEIDNRLTETGKSDANAFSDLIWSIKVSRKVGKALILTSVCVTFILFSLSNSCFFI